MMETNKLSIHFLCDQTEEMGQSLEPDASDISWVQKSNVKGYNSTEDLFENWVYTLRAATYSFMQQIHLEEKDSKIDCIFSSDCTKTIKGRGNLRRHVEWHLKRIEDTCKKRKDRLFGEDQLGRGRV
jgi:hypothetical protein